MTVGHLARNDILHENVWTRDRQLFNATSNQQLIDFHYVVSGMCVWVRGKREQIKIKLNI